MGRQVNRFRPAPQLDTDQLRRGWVSQPFGRGNSPLRLGTSLTKEREENMTNRVRILTIVTLILVLSLFYLETAYAEITIDGETIHVETNNYKVQFDRGVITQLDRK